MGLSGVADGVGQRAQEVPGHPLRLLERGPLLQGPAVPAVAQLDERLPAARHGDDKDVGNAEHRQAPPRLGRRQALPGPPSAVYGYIAGVEGKAVEPMAPVNMYRTFTVHPRAPESRASTVR